LQQLEAEHDNLRAALDGWPKTGAQRNIFTNGRLSLALLEIHGFIREGLTWLDLALKDIQIPPPTCAPMDARAGRLVRHLGDYTQANAMHEES